MGPQATPQYQKILEIHICAVCLGLFHAISVSIPLFSHRPTNMTLAGISTFERANEAVEYLQSRVPEALRNPQVAIVCGSGLGGLADTVNAESKAEYDYASIPHFPRPTGESLCRSARKRYVG